MARSFLPAASPGLRPSRCCLPAAAAALAVALALGSPSPAAGAEARGPCSGNPGRLLFCGNYTACQSVDGNATCAAGENRTCLYNASSQQEACGRCLAGYVDLGRLAGTTSRCRAIGEVSLEEFLDAAAPSYRESNETLAAERLEAMRARLQSVSELRALVPPLPYEVDVNKYSADLAQDYRGLAGQRSQENASALAGFPRFRPASGGRNLQHVPAAVNWVAEGAVTSVKNQGRCGCCWSISCMGAVEGATFITDTYIDSLSFQQLVSCDTSDGQDGCGGGSTVYAMEYAVSNSFGGLTLYSEYPFEDSGGTTTATCGMAGKNVTVQVYSPVSVASYSDTSTSLGDRIQEFKSAVAQQPVSITMNANCNTIQSYAGGVLTDDGGCACQSVDCIDHAVLLVGYNDTYDPPYWYIKNSWGADWGAEGYFYVAQEGGGDWGLFGILGEGVMALKAENTTAQVAETSAAAGPPIPTPTARWVGLAAFLASSWWLMA